MAYVKTTWVSGVAPPISAANLNNLETQYDEAIAAAAVTREGGNISEATTTSTSDVDLLSNFFRSTAPLRSSCDTV